MSENLEINWTVGDSLTVYDNTAKEVALVFGDTREHQGQRAKLIASSPELLSALQNLVGAITIQSPNLDKNIADAYAAIKKATE